MSTKSNNPLDPQLKALSEATQAVTSELSLEQVLQKIAQAARTLINAKYAALGVHDGHGHLSRFITAGFEMSKHTQVGPLPTGEGLLGFFLHRGESLIVNDIKSHPAAAGFPTHHPFMQSLLGVPIFSKGELIGALYLTDKLDGSDFTEADQQLIEMLALHAAIAIENANLYEQNQRLAVLEERERFARDLHDGIIQSIYAVGLSLDNIKAALPPSGEELSQQIDLSLKSLAGVITDLRNYIFDLRPHALKSKGIYARLEGLLKELKVNTLLPIQTEIDPDINDYLTGPQASHIFHIAHEALSNAARHARAKKIWVNLTRQGDTIILQVEDDGIGFQMPEDVPHGHHGLANITKRATILDAKLDIDSVPDRGTRLTLKVNGVIEKVLRKNFVTKLPYEAIIFDLDGTLIDTESADLWACQTLCLEHGFTMTPEFWAENLVGHMDNYGLLYEQVLQRNGNGTTPENLRRRLKELWLLGLEHVLPMPGVSTLLPALRAAGYPLAIATASDRAWANRWLTAFNLLPHFLAIATGDNVTHNKPAPDVYLYAAVQLGVKPEGCLVFENSPPGLMAAASAGMTSVAVLNHVTQTLKYSQAAALITNLEQVTVDWIETFKVAR